MSEFKTVDQIQQEQREKGEAFGKQVADFVNTFSDEKLKAAAKYMANRAHRHGQSQIMRLFLYFCEEMAANGDVGRMDGRNEGAVRIAMQIRSEHTSTSLPR